MSTKNKHSGETAKFRRRVTDMLHSSDTALAIILAEKLTKKKIKLVGLALVTHGGSGAETALLIFKKSGRCRLRASASARQL